MLVTSARGTDDVEQPRDDVHLDVVFAERADDADDFGRRILRERDDHALDIEQRDELRQAIGRAQHAQMLELGTPLLWIRVDVADEIDPVLRVVKDLPPEQLAHVAGADDDAVLQVGEAEPGRRPGDDAPDGHEEERQRPENGRLLRIEVNRARRRADDPECPRHHGDEVEDADGVVGGRVLGAFLVVVVEPVDARDDDPRGQRHEEHEELVPRADAVAVTAGDHLRQRERERETDEVGGEQHPPDKRAPAAERPRAPAMVEDLDGALVDVRGGKCFGLRERAHTASRSRPRGTYA